MDPCEVPCYEYRQMLVLSTTRERSAGSNIHITWLYISSCQDWLKRQCNIFHIAPSRVIWGTVIVYIYSPNCNVMTLRSVWDTYNGAGVIKVPLQWAMTTNLPLYALCCMLEIEIYLLGYQTPCCWPDPSNSRDEARTDSNTSQSSLLSWWNQYNRHILGSVWRAIYSLIYLVRHLP